ncbi:DUF2017 family protein [Naasia aerilata]|uniref:DUF2017 domain-containing protein n=1 Tax=Naasia aerilata TaxID=1162966 RepID=A0ABN6XKF2_9MICO|nr:DUF2017 family protein [Naasia aerilata]BDZ45311.1 hypothetical protein GCM10025866_12200 [Naasia aerilata]
MSGFVRSGDGVERTFSAEEREVLQTLCREFLALLAAGEDSALDRLLPDAYPDDPDASAEYAGYTRIRLARAKTEPAESILVDLGGGAGPTRLAPARIELWLRGLTDLRLVLHERLEEAGGRDPMLEELSDWLGWLLSDLLETIEP